jgi:hypothetical protein
MRSVPEAVESVSKLNLSDNQHKDLNAKNAKFFAEVAEKRLSFA